MNKELITKLIGRAREASENAYCPYTNVPIGCALLAEGNIYTGCNIESKVLSSSLSAGEVAIMKAISDGSASFKATCFFASAFMPFPDGKTRQLLAEFNPLMSVIIANDETYSLMTMNDIFPFVPELPEAE